MRVCYYQIIKLYHQQIIKWILSYHILNEYNKDKYINK